MSIWHQKCDWNENISRHNLIIGLIAPTISQNITKCIKKCFNVSKMTKLQIRRFKINFSSGSRNYFASSWFFTQLCIQFCRFSHSLVLFMQATSTIGWLLSNERQKCSYDNVKCHSSVTQSQFLCAWLVDGEKNGSAFPLFRVISSLLLFPTLALKLRDQFQFAVFCTPNWCWGF